MSLIQSGAAGRLTAVTALVVTLGALSGAITGFAIMVAAEAVAPGRLTGSVWRVYANGAVLGAVFGAMLGTPIALLLLRRVPLWRATVETAGAAGVGTVLGGLVVRNPIGAAAGALVLALLAAWRMRRAYAAAAQEESPVQGGSKHG